MFFLQLRMWLLVTILFGLIYALVVALGTSVLHVGNFSFYLIISVVMMVIQYMIGPKIVEWTMRIRYLKPGENPRLFQMVQGLATRANIPMPRICVSQVEIPNAFAFGRSLRDGRVCVTEGILGLLDDEELKAVLGHELSHLKNRDVLTITLLSVIPMILYWIAWTTMWGGALGGNRDSKREIQKVPIVRILFVIRKTECSPFDRRSVKETCIVKCE